MPEKFEKLAFPVVLDGGLSNLLEARGSISVSERQVYIGRVRRLARLAATTHLAKVEPKEE